VEVALLVSRVGLVLVFAVAGFAKLADPQGSRMAVAGFGVPARWAGVVGVLLPVAELAVAVALIPADSARFAAVGAALLLSLFITGIAVALLQGRAPECHCFGQVHSEPAGRRTLARNAALLVVAAFAAVGGWREPGLSATAWVAGVDTPWLVAGATGTLLATFIGFQVWFSLQLLKQNGRLLGRLENLEGALQGSIGVEPSTPLAVEAAPLGGRLGEGGLPIGATAPEFELEDADGQVLSVASLLASGRPLLLIFSDAGCGPCTAIMPEIARWQREHAQRLEIAVVASGDRERNRTKAVEHGVSRVLLQEGREVSAAYQAHGTPTAVLIDPAGRIASPLGGGANAIAALVARATGHVGVAPGPIPRGNGHDKHAESRPTRPPDTLGVGRPAPAIALSDLDGQRIALTDLYRLRTIAIFWNPGCGFCQNMLEDLKAFERDPPLHAPQLLIISAGDPQQVREQSFRSRALIDPDGTAMSAFGVRGTPMGVIIDNGRIASPIAIGADAVFGLARSPGPPSPTTVPVPSRGGDRADNGSLR
jgi:peroxiredoxin